MASLEATATLRCPIERVFDFLTTAENFRKWSPPELHLKSCRRRRSSYLAAGLRCRSWLWRAQNVIYEITGFARPHRFQETQVKGPLGRYVHDHELASQEDGTVRVLDRIHFEPPGGLLGFLLTEDRLRTSLKEGLVHRHRELKRLLEES